jgi:hypothetical protein
VDCKGLTICPKLFPYTLNAYSGQLLIENDRIQFHDVLAMPAGQMSFQNADQGTGLRINGNMTLTQGQLQAGQLKPGSSMFPEKDSFLILHWVRPCRRRWPHFIVHSRLPATLRLIPPESI